ncbi:hypothetical protein GCM10008938_30800 [Deinococcus roseus]|uniref:Uncharacterized protein n=2 Tax=Deinococcus roseus TaxID=392414 RepID=A0ABQ2D4M1_9DEIO|nr:hypothetical protein GCM10008938_30800 [Deinococcus roseus]
MLLLAAGVVLRARENSVAEEALATATLLAEDILDALREVETASPDSSGTGGKCEFGVSHMTVHASTASRFLEVPEGVQNAACTSNKTAFLVTVTTAGQQVQKSLKKVPPIRETMEALAHKGGQLVLEAISAVETANPDSTGAEVTCNFDPDHNTVTVFSGMHSRVVEVPTQISWIGCHFATNAHEVDVMTFRGIRVSETQPVNPAVLERSLKSENADQTLASKWAREVLHAMFEVEKTNPYSTGADATCRFGPEGVTVQSGTTKKVVPTPSQTLLGRCTSSKTGFRVVLSTSKGNTTSETWTK